MKLLIRKMTPGDFDGVLPLQHEIQALHESALPGRFRPEAVSYPRQVFDQVVNDPDWRCAVCEAEGRIVGFLFAWIRRIRDHRNMPDADVLLIDDICVTAQYRRRGVGRALFDYAQAAAKEAGCDRSELSVWAFNEEAMAFYRAMGFAPQIIRMEKKTEAER